MLVLLSMLAQAQSPAVPAQTLHVIGDAPVEAKRFVSDSAGSGGVVTIGSVGTVLFRESGWVRLVIGDRYVWLPEEATSTSAPAAPVNVGGGLKLGDGLGAGLQLGK